MDENSAEESVDPLTNQIIERIVNEKRAFFKSQQKDENDLKSDEKRLIVTQLLNNNKEVFLQRYGNYLLEEDLKYFDRFSDNHIINTQLNALRNLLKKNKTIIKNRRFEALQTLISKGDYFSDSEMQSRNPFLFEEMVGQYMTEKEKKELTDDIYSKNYEKITFSSFLMEQINKSEMEKRYKAQEEYEDNAREESDSDESQGELSEASGSQSNTPLESDERQRLKEEFKRIMFEQFLTGMDSEFFDYNQVDFNNEYDPSEIEDRDEEEKYFDAEDSNQ